VAESPPKEDVARTLLLRGSLFVYLDPRLEGVRVPPWLAKQAQLVLQVGLDLPIPIPDLKVDEEGVSGTLSFNRAPFTCVVPWSAIFGLVGDDGMGFVWNEDLPEEIAAEVADSMRKAGKDAPGRGPALRSIEGGAARGSEEPSGASSPEEGASPEEGTSSDEAPAAAAEAGGEGGADDARRKAPHLRLVK